MNTCLTASELIQARNGTWTAEQLAHIEQCELCAVAVDTLHIDYPADVTAAELAADVPPMPSTLFDEPRERPVLRVLKYVVGAAACLTLLWAAYSYSGKSEAPMEEFAYVEMPRPRQVRSAEAPEHDLYFAAAAAFEAGEYARSLELYDSAIISAPTPLLVTRGHYERGMTLWKAGKTTAAIEDLTAARFGEADYYEDATWALSRLYTSTGDKAKARLLLEDLLYLEQGPYIERAQRALAAMD